MGLVCCGSSIERKGEKSNMESSFSKPNYNSSPGRHVGDSDAIWEVTGNLVSTQEAQIKFTKSGIIHLFQQLSNLETFKNHFTSPNVKLWISENGTPYSMGIPCFKTEYIFDEKYSLSQIVGSIHVLEQREKWDKTIKKSFMLKQTNRLSIIYLLNKSSTPGVQARDFYEKKLHIKTAIDGNPKHYFYFTSIESDQYPPLDDVIRANILLGFHKFEVIPETGQVKSTFLLQCDLKLNKITMNIYKGMLKNTSTQFYNNLVKFIEANPDTQLQSQ